MSWLKKTSGNDKIRENERKKTQNKRRGNVARRCNHSERKMTNSRYAISQRHHTEEGIPSIPPTSEKLPYDIQHDYSYSEHPSGYC